MELKTRKRESDHAHCRKLRCENIPFDENSIKTGNKRLCAPETLCYKGTLARQLTNLVSDSYRKAR
jgi:hypothetical protein